MLTSKKRWISIFFMSTMFLYFCLHSKSFSYPSSSGYRSCSSFRSSHSSGQSHKNNIPIDDKTGFFGMAWLLLVYGIYKISEPRHKKGSKKYAYLDYDQVAQWFDITRSRDFFEKKYLDKIIAGLKPHAKILDIGCGMAEPVSQYFIEKGFYFVGIDGSNQLIELARKRYPKIKFLVQDMRTLKLQEKFDCIIVWHSLFHLPVEDQKNMFLIFVHHLNQSGMLLFTTGPKSDETWSNNGGIKMYHASFSPCKYKSLLDQYGFELILHVIEDKDCGNATVWIAKFKGLA